jgi:hypothetical protein
MPDLDILLLLKHISNAYPDKPMDEDTMKVYLEELADIPISLIQRAASQHIRSSAYFPRISDLRQIAQQLAGTALFCSIPAPGVDYLGLQAQQIEDDYFHHGEFDINKWEKLADQLERVERPHRAAELREKAHHIQESQSAHQRGENYPSREVCQRYATQDPSESLSGGLSSEIE